MMDSFHDGAVRGKAFVVPRLLKAIRRFPSVPALKNYLAVAYHVQDKKEQAAATETMLDAHPQYLFGRAMAATARIRKGMLDEALDLLGRSLRLRDLYPETPLFHISEVKDNILDTEVVSGVASRPCWSAPWRSPNRWIFTPDAMTRGRAAAAGSSRNAA
jgi:hypothetical protein